MKKLWSIFLAGIILLSGGCTGTDASHIEASKNQVSAILESRAEVLNREANGENTDGKKEETETSNIVIGMERKPSETKSMTSPSGKRIDIDLTVMSSNLIFAEVFNIVMNPDDYKGKIIKMQGGFAKHVDEETGKKYYAVIIQDATACCAQGIEFELSDKKVDLDGMFAEDDFLVVAGELDTYQEEDGFVYITLRNAELMEYGQ